MSTTPNQRDSAHPVSWLYKPLPVIQSVQYFFESHYVCRYPVCLACLIFVFFRFLISPSHFTDFSPPVLILWTMTLYLSYYLHQPFGFICLSLPPWFWPCFCSLTTKSNLIPGSVWPWVCLYFQSCFLNLIIMTCLAPRFIFPLPKIFQWVGREPLSLTPSLPVWGVFTLLSASAKEPN